MSGYLTGKDFIDSVILEVGESLANTDYRTVVLNWLNDGIDKALLLLQGYYFTEQKNTFNTVGSQASYDFSVANFYSDDIISMRCVNPERPMAYVDYFELQNSGIDLEQTGTPYYFYFYAFDTTKNQSLVRLFPIPSGIETIEVFYRFSSYNISDNTDKIPFPRYLLSALRQFVRSKMYSNEGDFTNADKEYNAFIFDIGEIKKRKTSTSSYNKIKYNDLPKSNRLPNRSPSGFTGGFGSGFVGSLFGNTISGVSSVGVNVPSFMTQSGSPITSAGYITLGFAKQAGNKFLASNSDGSLSDVDFRAISPSDLPFIDTHTQNTDTGTTHATWIINSTGHKLIQSSSGLAGDRTFTYPDTDGKVLTNASSPSDFPTLNQNTTGNALTATTATNATTAVNFSGSLSGDVSGTQSATTIGAGKVTNSMLAGSIAYGKLSLTGAILNTDLAGSIAYSKLVLTSSVVNGDIAVGAAIAYSKLNLSTSIVNADIAVGAAIAYSKLNLSSSIVNADIAVGAAIANSKLANSTISGVSLGSNLNSLTIGTGLSGSSYNGSAPVTVAIDSTVCTLTGLQVLTNKTIDGSSNTISNITEAMQTLANNTTNNVSITKHGYAPILPNDATKYLDGTGAWSVPAGGGGSSVTMAGDVTGASNACTVAKINGVTLGTTTATSANVLIADGTSWVTRAISGDITIGNTGVTAIGASKVTNSMLAGSIAYSKLSLTGAILNADLAGSIAYSKLTLTTSIVNGDISASAAIAYSKLSLTTSIVNGDISASAAIVYSKLSLGNSIVNADISSSAAIAYSKLSLATSIVNADISASAAIAYSKLNLSNSIVNADIGSAAAIAYSKLSLSNSIVAGDLTANCVTAAKLESASNGQLHIGNGTGFTKASITSTNGTITITAGSGTLAMDVTSPLVLTEFQVDGANGALCKIKCASTLHTISSAGTSTATNAIPAGALVLGVTAYNVSAVGGTGTTQIGDGTTANLWANTMSVLSGQSSNGTNFLAAASPKYYPTATSIVLTKSTGTYNGTGQVRLKVWYIDMTAPTS